MLFDRELLTRQVRGQDARIRAAHFSARKTVDDFDSTHQGSRRQLVVVHLTTLSFVAYLGCRLGPHRPRLLFAAMGGWSCLGPSSEV